MLLAECYSGHFYGVNYPKFQDLHDIGPIPEGYYNIGDAIQFHEKLGVYVIPLNPYGSNRMFGREGFYIHGDEIKNPGKFNGSDGCIVMPLFCRKIVGNHTDKVLVVV